MSRTRQTDGLNTFEVTPRVGLRFHLLSRGIRTVALLDRLRDRPPKRRLVVRDWVRVEQRNFFYNDGTPTSSTGRLRNRLEFQFPLNRASVTDDGSRTLLADWEWFVLGTELEERFASHQRIRTGFALRHSYEWRTELVYMWNRSRNTTGEPFSTSDNIFSLTVKRTFP